jgi:hypothetical protein
MNWSRIGVGILLAWVVLQGVFMLLQAREIKATREEVHQLQVKVAGLMTARDAPSHGESEDAQPPLASTQQVPLAKFLAQVVIWSTAAPWRSMTVR